MHDREFIQTSSPNSLKSLIFSDEIYESMREKDRLVVNIKQGDA